jgi:hypothetical protein
LDVEAWLVRLGLAQYADAFRANHIRALICRGPCRCLPLSLSIPATAAYPEPDMTPATAEGGDLDAAGRSAGGLAGAGPVLMVVEDLHWLDPTTRKLLDLIVGRIETLPVLLVVIFRPLRCR